MLADDMRAGADALALVEDVPSIGHGVELLERVDLRDRDKAVATEPADLTHKAAFLIGPGQTWLAVQDISHPRSEPMQTIQSVRACASIKGVHGVDSAEDSAVMARIARAG
jgi:hypothetical protein